MNHDEFQWWDPDVLDRERWGRLVEPVLERVIRARDRGRLPHAMLLVGPPGLGRELAAVEAAALLICERMRSIWATGSCADRVRQGIHPDVEAMIPRGARGIIKIDPVRKGVVERVAGRPYEGQRRVWIFDGVEEERFPKPSANAFLKTLEEPPDHVVFILLAANPTAVLPTIRSRCQQLSLPGAVAVSANAGCETALPELAPTALAGRDVAGAEETVRNALETGLGGRADRLVRLPWCLPDGVPPFGVTAAVALTMAGEGETPEDSEVLARLASDLLAAERVTRALNLNARTQLLSSLLRWFQGL